MNRAQEPHSRGGGSVAVALHTTAGLAGEPPGDEVAGLRSFRPINRAQEPRSRGGGSVAVALYATAGLAG